MEVEVEVLCFFPFLRKSSDYIKEIGVSLDDLIYSAAFERARDRGCERVISAIKTGEVSSHHVLAKDVDMEILSYPFARILVSCIGDTHLARRYARAEAKTAYKILSASISDETLLHALAEDLGVTVLCGGASHTSYDGVVGAAKLDFGVRMYRIHFTDYLRLASELKGSKWRLVNRMLHEGFVMVSGNDLLQLFHEAFYDRVRENLPIEVPRDICDAVRKYTDEIRQVLSVNTREDLSIACDEISQSAFPPCISYLLKRLMGGEEISHSARFALTSFLLNIGMRTEDIIRLYEKAPDFDAEKTRYQIEHIAGSRGTKYTAPSCRTMRTYGICVRKNDELCEKVAHPLGYYALAKEKEKSEKRRNMR